MAEVRKYSHDIFHKPGDEGSAPSLGQADCANEAAPPGGSHEHVHRPGSEGSAGLGNPDMSPESNVMGYQNTPGAPLGEWLQGPEVRKTRVAPASGADPTPGMPGAK